MGIDAMRTSRLGRSAVEVTQLGFGGGPLGGLFAPLDDDTAAGALAAAWDCGIRYFDTSPHYSIGVSERRVGELLRRKLRAEFTLSTKVGRVLVPQDPAGRTDESFEVPATHRRVWDFSREGVLRSVDDSLARIGVDRVDVLFLHDAEDHFESALRDGYPALAELRARGVVGAIGAGMYHTGMLTRLVQETDVDVVMLSGRYTLLNHSALACFPPTGGARGFPGPRAAILPPGGPPPAAPPPHGPVRLRARRTGIAAAGAPHRRCLRGARRDASAGGNGLPAGPSRGG